MALRVFRDWLTLHLSNRLGIRMLSDYLAKLLQLPLSFFETRATGEHIQRIQDHNRVQSFFSATTLNTIFSFFTLIVFSAVLFYFDSQIFVIFLLGSILYIFWSIIFMKRRKLLDYKNFDQQSENQSSLIEILDGVSEIKINNSQRKKRWLWEGIQIDLFKLSMKTLTLSQVQGVGASVINELKNIIVTFLSAKAVIDGQMTLGMMISTQYIIGQLNVPLNNFMSFLQQGQDAKISLERLSQVHNAKNEDDKNSFSSTDFLLSEPADIIIKDLSFRYGGKSSPEVLKNLNFTIPCGKTTAVVGTSGSGKTTLIKLLLKFYLPTDGEICIGKSNLKNINSDNWRSKCGSVLQEGYLFNDSIAGNISESEQSGIIDRQNVISSAHIANIQGYIQQLPNGYNTLIGRRGVSMSGGQKQRILIARQSIRTQAIYF